MGLKKGSLSLRPPRQDNVIKLSFLEEIFKKRGVPKKHTLFFMQHYKRFYFA